MAVAVAITAPASLAPWARLVGDPRVDVWNHAWGYWWVARSAREGVLPWATALVGAPEGGVLWFIDLAGAVAGLPLTLAAGPAVAYNLVLIGRIALTGMGAHLLAEELVGRGPHAWFAGAAACTMPYLACELANGISEVAALQWTAFALWAAVRALRRDRWTDWLLLGAFGALAGWGSFYYGLAAGLTVGPVVVAALIRRRGAPLGRALCAAGIALAVAIPAFLAFRASLAHPDALVRRPPGLASQIRTHSAVDPRVFVVPGDFQTVDLEAEFGEALRHTGYLRWTVLVLGAVALRRRRALRPWALLAAVPLALSLGPFLWWGDDWVRAGDRLLMLPFGALQRLVPGISITHPLRLAAPAQLLAVALAAAALAGRSPRAVAAAGALAVLETAFASAATLPVPTSPAAVPSLYGWAPGAVLDLPAEVGTTMETSRYFWYQTRHGRPIPYTPDVRAGSARDRVLFDALFPTLSTPAARLEPAVAAHVRRSYGLIVVHGDLARRAGQYDALRRVLTEALGPPQEVGTDLVWRPGD